MNAATIDDLIKALGSTYPELITSGLHLPGAPPKGIFEDSDTIAMSPEAGIELEFWASTQRFEALYISLLKRFAEQSTYKGKTALPPRNQDEPEMGQIPSRRTSGIRSAL